MPDRDPWRRWVWRWSSTGLIALLLGCQQDRGASAPQPPRTLVSVNGQPIPTESGTGAPSPPPPSIERALKSDPCAARLHEISGAMLAYQAIYGRLPRALEDLDKVRGPGEGPLNFTCPATGEAYVYVPAGLRSADDPRQVVLHDAAPDASGLRWVILMQPARGRQAAATWVTRLTEPAFRGYAPARAATRPAS